ncbi:hypothetical protein KC909_01265 [Candidatus Dojkabacteria bacterium]|uniref:Uncharacterized protein n=1 Tax=Candidatus Dojkabacteria bacterium TaxID=2099670 RepID=A0A955L4X4_9BACT|nr:hypothetical protein [Candidatus Dojkabacteria bacterium]
MAKSNKNKKTNTVLGILLVFFLIFVFGVLLFSNSRGSEDTNNEGYVSTSPFRDQLNEWPEYIPDSVPVFTYGQLDSGSENSFEEGQMIWYVLIIDLGDSALASYKADLEAVGWNITVDEDIEDGYIAASHTDTNLKLQLSITGKTAILTIQSKP